MGKLIELLNEYMQPYIKYKGWNVPGRYFLNYDEGSDLHEEEVISKKFGFIKRLIQNDKVDLDEIEQRAIDFFYDESPVRGKEIRAERLIMMLSVQDNPIEDLISCLK